MPLFDFDELTSFSDIMGEERFAQLAKHNYEQEPLERRYDGLQGVQPYTINADFPDEKIITFKPDTPALIADWTYELAELIGFDVAQSFAEQMNKQHYTDNKADLLMVNINWMTTKENKNDPNFWSNIHTQWQEYCANSQ